MDKVMTVDEIAGFLKIKPNTIHNRKWQQRTGCPLVKRGKRLLIKESDFMIWFEQGAVV